MTPPSDPRFSWEDFEGDFEKLKGTIAKPKSLWTRYLLIGAGALTLSLGASGWYYFSQTKTNPSRKSIQTFSHHLESLEKIAHQLDQNITNKKQLLDSTFAALSIAMETQQSSSKASSISATDKLKTKFEAAMYTLKGLLRLKVEKFLNLDEKEDMDLFTKILSSVGTLRFEYQAEQYSELIPILQEAWLKERISLLESKTPNSPLSIELRDALKIVQKEQSFSITEACLSLGAWFRYKNWEDLSEKTFDIGRKNVEGYYIDNVFYFGEELKEFSPLWSAYAETLESLAGNAYKKGLFREARSYILRLFHTPYDQERQTKYYSWTKESLDSLHTQIDHLKKDLKRLNDALDNPDTLPTYPAFDLDQTWVINWEVLDENFKKTSFFNRKNPIISTIWEKLPPELRSQILLNPSSTWQTESNKKEVIKVLNQILQNPLTHTAYVDDKIIKQKSLDPKEHSKRPQINSKAFLTESLNRKALDKIFGSSEYYEYFLSDGTLLHQTLLPEQKREFLFVLEEDLAESGNDSNKTHLEELINALRSETETVSVIDFERYLSGRLSTLENKRDKIDRAFEIQNNHLRKIQKELASLETLESIDTTLILDSRQKEIAIKRGLLTKKFQKEQIESKVRKTNKLQSNLFNGFKMLIGQKEKEMEALTERFNRQRALSFESHTETIYALKQATEEHEALLKELYEIQRNHGNTSLKDLHTELSKNRSELQKLIQEIPSLPQEEKFAALNKQEALEKQQNIIVGKLNLLFSPIKKIIQKIADQEIGFNQKQKELTETQQHISRLVGSNEKPGILQNLAKQQSNYLLMKVEAGYSEDLNNKIEELNKHIQEEYSSLSFLLFKEQQLRDSIRILTPPILEGKSKASPEDLAKVTEKLDQQEELFEHYQILWREEELLSELEIQENLAMDALKQISSSLMSMKNLNENQIYDINRAIDTIIRSGNERERIQRELQDFSHKSSSAPDKSRGYFLDTTEYFRYESQLGLDLSLYEKAFFKRSSILNSLLSLIQEKEVLEKQNQEAIVLQDQLLIDQLSHKIANIEHKILALGEEEIQVNTTILHYAESFLKKIKQAREKRSSLAMTETDVHKRLSEIQKKINAHDRDFFNFAGDLYKHFTTIDLSLNSLDLEKFTQIDSLIDASKAHLQKLKHFQNRLEKDNYYKAKALWLLGMSYYQQAKLVDFLSLKDALKIPQNILRDEKKHTHVTFENFEPDFLPIAPINNNKEELETTKNQLALRSWIFNSQESAIRIFQELLPKYLETADNQKILNSFSLLKEKEELFFFFSESRFMTSKIYLERALHHLDPKTEYKPDQNLAKRYLNKSESLLKDYIEVVGVQEAITPNLSLDIENIPFLHVKRISDQLAQAQINLGIIYFLKEDHQKSIAILRGYLEKLLEETHFEPKANSNNIIGQTEQIPSSLYVYDPDIDPFYASILSSNPPAQSALYQLALNYQILAQRENYKLYQPTDENYQKKKNRFKHYSSQAIAYYSQLIDTEIYSPLRSIALLQRSRLWQNLDEYNPARRDLITLLSSSFETPPTSNQSYFFAINDILGFPPASKSLVFLELGQLYFANKDYQAASDAFQQASLSSEDNSFIFEAKSSFANALFAQKKWVEAIYIYQELLRERSDEGLGAYLKHGPDILLNLAKSHLSLGNLTDAQLAFSQLFTFAPHEIVKENLLDLSKPYALDLLTKDYKDSIRPLALASYYLGKIDLAHKEYTSAEKHFSNAQKLFPIIPWKEDAKLRKFSKKAYLSYLSDWNLKGKWALMKLKAEELFSSSFLKSQRMLNFSIENASGNHLVELIQDIRSAILNYRNDREEFASLFNELTKFKEREEEKLLYTQEKKRVTRNLLENKESLSDKYQTYQALLSIERQLDGVNKNSPISFLSELIATFPENSLENSLINDFAYNLTKSLSLSKEDRSLMEDELQNIENLLTVPQLNLKVPQLVTDFTNWLSRELALSDLDTRFIKIGPEEKTIEEIDYYRAACLNVMHTSSAYDQLQDLASKYLEALKAPLSRISNLPATTGILELAALAAYEKEDWLLVSLLYAPLLEPDYVHFFTLPESWDLYLAKLYYAEALKKLSTEKLSQAVFMSESFEKKKLLEESEKDKNSAYNLLNELKSLPGDNTANSLMRIRASELLKQWST